MKKNLCFLAATLLIGFTQSSFALSGCLKHGWPVSQCSGSNCVSVNGTTNTSSEFGFSLSSDEQCGTQSGTNYSFNIDSGSVLNSVGMKLNGQQVACTAAGLPATVNGTTSIQYTITDNGSGCSATIS